MPKVTIEATGITLWGKPWEISSHLGSVDAEPMLFVKILIEDEMDETIAFFEEGCAAQAISVLKRTLQEEPTLEGVIEVLEYSNYGEIGLPRNS